MLTQAPAGFTPGIPTYVTADMGVAGGSQGWGQGPYGYLQLQQPQQQFQFQANQHFNMINNGNANVEGKCAKCG